LADAVYKDRRGQTYRGLERPEAPCIDEGSALIIINLVAFVKIHAADCVGGLWPYHVTFEIAESSPA